MFKRLLNPVRFVDEPGTKKIYILNYVERVRLSMVDVYSRFFFVSSALEPDLWITSVQHLLSRL